MSVHSYHFYISDSAIYPPLLYILIPSIMENDNKNEDPLVPQSLSPVIIPDETSCQLSITLGDITFDSSTTVVVYLMSAPVNLKDKPITVCFTNMSGTKFTETKTPSRVYSAESIGGLTCNNLVRSGDFSNGVGVDDQILGNDDETLSINQ